MAKNYKMLMFRVGAYDAERLQRIAGEYGFRSVYGLLRWVSFTFLRAADPDNDPMCDPLPLDIIKLFDIKEDAELVHKCVLRVRRNAWDRAAYKKKRESEPVTSGDPIADEVAEMFAECESAGVEREWKPNIQQRKMK